MLDVNRVKISCEYGDGRILLSVSEEQARSIGRVLLGDGSPKFGSVWQSDGESSPLHEADWFYATADHLGTGCTMAFVQLGEEGCQIGVSLSFTNPDDPRRLDGTRTATVPSDHDILEAAMVLRDLLALAD